MVQWQVLWKLNKPLPVKGTSDVDLVTTSKKRPFKDDQQIADPVLAACGMD